VAIGNAHGEYRAKPDLQFAILEEIAGKVSVPLVLHGGSGISDEAFKQAIRSGIKKVNIATASFAALTEKVREYILCKANHNYFALNEAMIQGVYENVKRHIGVFNK
jgi:fructose-bisphosphate aldolase class II